MPNSFLRLSSACLLVLVASVRPSYAQNRIDGEFFNDPTRPFLSAISVQEKTEISAKVSKSLFVLNFVRMSEKFPIAIVNGTQVSVGSLINGAEVVGITSTGVELMIGGEYEFVQAFSSIVKAFEK